MEALMQLVVPHLDGGIFRPLFSVLGAGIGNFSEPSPAFEFELSEAGVRNVSRQLWHLDEVGISNASSCGLNATSPMDVGGPLLVWYAARLRSQIPLFVVASLMWLLLLGGLIFAYLTRRRRLRGRLSKVASRRLFVGMTTASLILLLIGCVLAALHWAGRAGFSGLAGSNPGANGTAGGTHLTATFRRAIDRLDALVESSIVEANVTVPEVARQQLPRVHAVLDTVARHLLDGLAEDFRLTPLLEAFDRFLDLLKLLLRAMRRVKASRSEVAFPLAAFASELDSARRAISDHLPGDRLPPLLARLKVGVDHRRLDTDTSVTVVTLLERMLKLNVSEVEQQVRLAKRQLYGSIDLVRSELDLLQAALLTGVSVQFSNALADAQMLREDLRSAKGDRGFLVVMATIDRVALALSVCLALGCVIFLAAFTFSVVTSILHAREPNPGPRTPPPDHDGTVAAIELLDSSERPPPSDDRPSRGSNRGPAACVSARSPLLLLLSCCLLLLCGLLYALALFYAGSEAHMDACRYMTTADGVTKLDQFLDSLVRHRLWPQVSQVLDRAAGIPLGIEPDRLPTRMLAGLINGCGTNGSATVFRILGLSRLLNVTQLLNSGPVRAKLERGSSAIQDLVRGLNTSGLIPPEVDDLLGKTLPGFAAVLDSEDFSASIQELRRPLVSLDMADWRQLSSDLRHLADDMLRANSSDPRPALLGYFIIQADSLLDKGARELAPKLRDLLSHFLELQENRRLANLTLYLGQRVGDLKLALGNKDRMLADIESRYQMTLDKHLGTVADLATDLAASLGDRLARCGPLLELLRIPIDWCKEQIAPLPWTGLYLIFSCLAFYVIVHLQLVLLGQDRVTEY